VELLGMVQINGSKQQFLVHHRRTCELISTAFETERIFSEVPIAEFKELGGYYIELLLDVIRLVEDLSRLWGHNEYSFTHSLNVAIICGTIGKWLGYTGEVLKDLILAGLLHDIGKTFIPLTIINKPRKLSAKEMDVVKEHSSKGYNLLKELDWISSEVKAGVFQHHERLDGSGYPLGLFNEKISFFARIIAIADMYDAMTNERVYRARMSHYSAVQAIIGDIDKKLDRNICMIFLTKTHNFFADNSTLLNKKMLLNNK
jgi:putative nucleotidyltransferase with HDIG domain